MPGFARAGNVQRALWVLTLKKLSMRRPLVTIVQTNGTTLPVVRASTVLLVGIASCRKKPAMNTPTNALDSGDTLENTCSREPKADGACDIAFQEDFQERIRCQPSGWQKKRGFSWPIVHPACSLKNDMRANAVNVKEVEDYSGRGRGIQSFSLIYYPRHAGQRETAFSNACRLPNALSIYQTSLQGHE